ncbi:MAG: hypothetical protein J0L67_04120 [Cytophagales bacterium]|nr:hypothetical protein [Cytophagales bacterium]
MNRILLLPLLLLSLSCHQKRKANEPEPADSHIIKTLYEKDLEIRKLNALTDTIDLEKYDQGHREKIFQLLAENKVFTPSDKIRAAWILQHTPAKVCEGELTSLSSENFLLAYYLSSSALAQLTQEKGTLTMKKENVPRITALNYDRYLLFTFGHQSTTKKQEMSRYEISKCFLSSTSSSLNHRNVQNNET